MTYRPMPYEIRKQMLLKPPKFEWKIPDYLKVPESARVKSLMPNPTPPMTDFARRAIEYENTKYKHLNGYTRGPQNKRNTGAMNK